MTSEFRKPRIEQRSASMEPRSLNVDDCLGAKVFGCGGLRLGFRAVVGCLCFHGSYFQGHWRRALLVLMLRASSDPGGSLGSGPLERQ